MCEFVGKDVRRSAISQDGVCVCVCVSAGVCLATRALLAQRKDRLRKSRNTGVHFSKAIIYHCAAPATNTQLDRRTGGQGVPISSI